MPEYTPRCRLVSSLPPAFRESALEQHKTVCHRDGGLAVYQPVILADAGFAVGDSELVADHFAGNGSGLTSLNASQLTSGTVPSAVVSGTYANAVVFNNASSSFAGNGSS